MIRLGGGTLPSWDSTAISLPIRNSPPQACWEPSLNNLSTEKESRSIYGRLFRRPGESLAAEAYLGCEEIIITLLEMNKWDVRASDFSGKTAITWAARRGHSGVVRVLLERSDIDPSVADTKYGRTLLSQAAGNGHEGVVRVLLERTNINPNTPDTIWPSTALVGCRERA